MTRCASAPGSRANYGGGWIARGRQDFDLSSPAPLSRTATAGAVLCPGRRVGVDIADAVSLWGGMFLMVMRSRQPIRDVMRCGFTSRRARWLRFRAISPACTVEKPERYASSSR